MPFNTTTGVYTPAGGATNAATGQVIQSAVWNTIHADFGNALTTLGELVLPGNSNAVWTAYTPTVSSFQGTITSYSAAGRYYQMGKIVFVEMTASIIVNGSGANALQMSLPLAAKASIPNGIAIFGREVTSGGMLQSYLAAVGNNSIIQIATYNNQYPGSLAVAVLGGTYEAL